MIALRTIYDKNIDSAWIFKENICREAEYIRYNSLGDFARFKLSFEIYESLEPVVFENLAKLEDDKIGNKRFEHMFNIFTEGILLTLEYYMNELYLSGYPIINLKIVLSDLEIHEGDSRQSSYKCATQILLHKLFKTNILVKAY